MTPSKFVRVSQSMNAMAQKVYVAVPINEEWTLSDIIREMHRNGTRCDHPVLQGCISALIASGLVREPQPGTYIRTRVKPKIEDRSNVENEPMPKSSVDRLADLAAELRALAAKIDDAALEVAKELEAVAAKSTKLTQLQALLKELT